MEELSKQQGRIHGRSGAQGLDEAQAVEDSDIGGALGIHSCGGSVLGGVGGMMGDLARGKRGRAKRRKGGRENAAM